MTSCTALQINSNSCLAPDIVSSAQKRKRSNEASPGMPESDSSASRSGSLRFVLTVFHTHLISAAASTVTKPSTRRRTRQKTSFQNHVRDETPNELVVEGKIPKENAEEIERARKKRTRLNNFK